MKREEIEKAAEKVRLKMLGVQTHPILEQPYRNMEQAIADEIIEQVNAALEEARVEISEAQDIESAMNIVDQLKIK